MTSAASPNHSARRRRRGFIVAFGVLLGSCQPVEVAVTTAHGQAMGTSYTLRYVPPVSAGPSLSVTKLVDAELARFNKVFSTYDPESEISSFNKHASLEPFAASAELSAVVRRALVLAERTGGAFDPTLGPLTRLRGFGPGSESPDPAALEKARAVVGWRKLEVLESGALQKKVAGLELDLNAIAKGTGVDAVATLLDGLGCTSYMVEIGGEVRCRGRKPDGKLWRIGIAYPKGHVSPDGSLYADKIDLPDCAMATSGNYEQFRKLGDRRLEHIVDGRTGENPDNRVLSVTVIAKTCELADALATALMALGPDGAEPLIAAHPDQNVKVLFLLAQNDSIQKRPFHWN